MRNAQRILLLFLCLITLVVTVNLTPPKRAMAQSETCGRVTRWNIVRERDLGDIGDVYIWNTYDGRMFIRPVLMYNWRMQESWMEVKTYFGGLPKNPDGTFNYPLFRYHRTFYPHVTEDLWNLKMTWLTGTEMHIAMRFDVVKYNNSGTSIIDSAVAWGYQKAVGPAMYFKHTIQICRDLSQYQGCK